MSLNVLNDAVELSGSFFKLQDQKFHRESKEKIWDVSNISKINIRSNSGTQTD